SVASRANARATSAAPWAALRVDPAFLPTVEALSHENIRLCYYCLKCTAGCPTAYAMDYGPAQVLKLVQLGQKDKVLQSKAIWLCVGCETCWTRCPNGIAAGHVMDALKQMAVQEGCAPAERRVLVLHRQFLTSIRLFGRVHELSMLALYKLLSGDLFTDLDLGARMFLRGKIPILPERIKGMAKIRQLFSKQPRGQA
ncbi:MAG: 4Fe-4S dicluster domain-containing protein, partial [Anaerolineae bacterium]